MPILFSLRCDDCGMESRIPLGMISSLKSKNWSVKVYMDAIQRIVSYVICPACNRDREYAMRMAHPMNFERQSCDDRVNALDKLLTYLSSNDDGVAN